MEDALFKLDWTNEMRGVPEWYRDAKFGLFFHWGPYSVPAFGNEYYSHNMYNLGQFQHYYHELKYGKLSEFGYKDFMPMFTAPKFNPDEWAEMISLSGAKFAGPVSEHADNFSMWNSKINPINSMTYMHRDVVEECFRAFRQKGIKCLCSFHNQFNVGWFQGTDMEADSYDEKYEQFYGKIPNKTDANTPLKADVEFSNNWLRKITECVTTYKPDIVYFDGMLSALPEEIRKRAIQTIYATNPDAMITSKGTELPNGVGGKDLECKRYDELQTESWESGDRMETNVTWCWVEDTEYKSAKRIIESIVDVTSKNGIYLMNIGPKADGSFDVRAKHILLEVGDWLRRNGEAVYSTRPFSVFGEGEKKIAYSLYGAIVFNGKFGSGVSHDSTIGMMGEDDIRFTTDKAGKFVYAIFFQKPTDGKVHIRSLAEGINIKKIESIHLTDTTGSLNWKRSTEALEISIPENLPEDLAYVLKIKKG